MSLRVASAKMTEAEFLGRFRNRRQIGPRTWCARCLGHDGMNEFLNIARGDQEFRVYCREGCRRAEVLQAHALTDRDLLIDGDGETPRGADGQQNSPAQSRMLEAALEYAERGVPVFPVWSAAGGQCRCGMRNCENPGKHPITKNGFLDASADTDQIRAWWTEYPDANIAAPTGEQGIVLDEDPREGGDNTLWLLEQEHGALPRTPIVHTGGGGRHLRFQRPAGVIVRNSAGRVGDGLDVRGEGGYVLLPPSAHVSGRSYVDAVASPWFHTPPAPIPPCLLPLLTKPGTTNTGHQPP